MSNVNEIRDSYLCYGCGVCNVICGHDAITMQYDNIGRLCPIIDEESCSDCGLCMANCPSIDLKGIQLPDTDDKYVGHVNNVYIGRSNDETIFRNSQSGGMVTATIKYLLDTKKIDAAIVCKVVDEMEYTPKATLITSSDELYNCQKSSYVPIDMVSAIKIADHYNSLAVVGTGCQIQGFHALKEYKKIYRDRIRYLLGLICDRTLCKTATDVLYGNSFINEKKRIIWRDKSMNYKTARLLIQTESGEQKELPRWKRVSLKDPFTNPRCRICFDKLNTHADIVFGDPWGMNNVDWQNGMSVVMTRTIIGTEIIDSMIQSSLVSLCDAPLSEVISGQHIEKRKIDVSKALAYYVKAGWMLPSYAQSSLEIKTISSDINKKIKSFVDDSLLSKDEIVSKNRSFLKKEFIKRNKFAKTIKNIIYYLLRLIK